MSELRPVFDEILQDYLSRLESVWERIPCDELGVTRRDGRILVPFYGSEYELSPRGFEGVSGGLLGHAICVALANYLLGPLKAPGSRTEPWTAFREFPDSAPFRHGFDDMVERKLASQFSGRREDLSRACAGLGGLKPEPGFSYDVAQVLPALPKVPVLLLFNDAEEGFPAGCTLLYPANADSYLDMECLVILGTSLPSLLEGSLQAD